LAQGNLIHVGGIEREHREEGKQKSVNGEFSLHSGFLIIGPETAVSAENTQDWVGHAADLAHHPEATAVECVTCLAATAIMRPALFKAHRGLMLKREHVGSRAAGEAQLSCRTRAAMDQS
jgi:hypothetical protein